MKKQWFDPQVTEISVKMTEFNIYKKAGTGSDSLSTEEGDHMVPCTNCVCTS